jgi:anhydro-N-acetylmuramic acid kinase
MSGTSADGIDAVAADIWGEPSVRVKLLAHVHRPFAAGLRRSILDAAVAGSVGELCRLNFLLGERFAEAAAAVVQAAKLGMSDVAAIGSHGQTFHHLPNGRPPSTLQLGEAAIIAQRTGIVTIADFRVADLAAGGQGAPLVPFADWVLFTDALRPRIVQNIGGIANLTFLPAGGGLDQVLAFDTGPGNMVLDALVTEVSGGRKQFDRNGRLAAQGKVSGELLAKMMAHPFLRRPPPKTTGREEFGPAFAQQVLMEARRRRLREVDIIATATAFTVTSIGEAYRRLILPRVQRGRLAKLQVILGGGGACNPTLRAMLKEQLGSAELLTHEDFGIPNQAKEALAFALLARQTWLGLPGNVPSATGARHAAILGKIALPPQFRPAGSAPARPGFGPGAGGRFRAFRAIGGSTRG